MFSFFRKERVNGQPSRPSILAHPSHWSGKLSLLDASLLSNVNVFRPPKSFRDFLKSHLMVTRLPLLKIFVKPCTLPRLFRIPKDSWNSVMQPKNMDGISIMVVLLSCGVVDALFEGIILMLTISVFLGEITHAYKKDPQLTNLLLDPFFTNAIHRCVPSFRRVVSQAVLLGVPVPCFSSSLSFYDGFRSAKLPANLLQAQVRLKMTYLFPERLLWRAHVWTRRQAWWMGSYQLDWSWRTCSFLHLCCLEIKDLNPTKRAHSCLVENIHAGDDLIHKIPMWSFVFCNKKCQRLEKPLWTLLLLLMDPSLMYVLLDLHSSSKSLMTLHWRVFLI